MPEHIKIAVVGYGLIGRRHAEIIRRAADLELAAIVDADPDARKAAGQTGAPVHADLQSMIEKESPDGIVLATPTPLHLEQGLVCVAAGCPVFIEKPITVTAADAKILNDKAAAAQVPLLIGHHRRHNGMIRAAKKVLDDGTIGDIRAIQATCWFYKPDYYFDAALWRKKKGAGPISVNLVHDVDLLRYLCGDIDAVQAMAVPSRRGFENEDLAMALLRFKIGAIATISVSDSIAAPWSWEMTARENPAYPATAESCYLIGGSEGALSLPDLRVWRHEGGLDWWKPIASTHLTCDTEDPLAVQMAHFARVIRGEEDALVSGLQGMKSLEAVEAIAMSVEHGKAVKIAGNDKNPPESA